VRNPVASEPHPARADRPSAEAPDWPADNEVRRSDANFIYQSATWTKPRRVIANVEWHPGELYPRVGFIVTKMARSAKNVITLAMPEPIKDWSLTGLKEKLIKIGAAGKVLLGLRAMPGVQRAGAQAILRKSDNESAVAKLYRASVTLRSGQTAGKFTVISEPLRVPFIQYHAQNEYVKRVAIQEEQPWTRRDAKALSGEAALST
jgi:hypothetical protein